MKKSSLRCRLPYLLSRLCRLHRGKLLRTEVEAALPTSLLALAALPPAQREGFEGGKKLSTRAIAFAALPPAPREGFAFSGRAN